MPRLSLLLLLALVCAPGLGRAESEDDSYADTDEALLVIRKSVAGTSSELQVVGRNVTVELTLHNAGAATAKDVHIKDTLPASAQLLDGQIDVNIGKIASGSTQTVKYTIVFTGSGGIVALPVAQVTYRADPDAPKTTTGYSSSPALYVLTPVQQIQRYALQAGSYVTLGVARTPSDWRNLAAVSSVIILAVTINWATKTVSTSRKATRRQRALEELQKSN